MKIWLTAAAAAVLSAGLLASAPAAQARVTPRIPESASGCNTLFFGAKAGACIAITGKGIQVNSVAAGANIWPGTTMRGSFRIYDTDEYLNFTTLTYTCTKTWTHPYGYCWSLTYRVNKSFPTDDQICATFNSGHAVYGPACKTIE
jgi:hypothetical protein